MKRRVNNCELWHCHEILCSAEVAPQCALLCVLSPSQAVTYATLSYSDASESVGVVVVIVAGVGPRDELGHVLRAQVDGLEVLEELLLGQPEHAVVRIHRLADALDLRVALPACTVVGPHARRELALAPRVAHLDEVELRARSVVEASDHGVRVSDAVRGAAVGAHLGLGASRHDVVLIVPGAHALEHLVLADLGLYADFAVVRRPGHRPESLEALARRVVQILPKIGVRVTRAEALEAVTVVHEGVLVLAAGQHPPRMRAVAALQLVPAAAVDGEGLLQVAGPQLRVGAGLAAEEAAVI
mmetsp:Transcript_95960/g.248126  ORF Transcript_95960/g.248126 Transcript_95960/m.248126 type:complete len:300 (-) Transcript_95960:902-1801(-)